MFNQPRAPAYGSFGGSFVGDGDPLSSSSYGDPWSTTPSPIATPPPPSVPPMLSNIIANASIPPIYDRAFQAVDLAYAGEVSINSLSRVISSSSLPAATLDRIVNLVSSRSRVSKLEFYVAMALTALAQSDQDLSIEQVAALASQDSLPEPKLALETLQAQISAFQAKADPPGPHSPAPQYSADDPWNSAFRVPATHTNGVSGNAASASAISGAGLPVGWWKRQEKVTISFVGQAGIFLNRHMVYSIATERGDPVHRRYSEFAFLYDYFLRRYPFRLIFPLPPKRVQPDVNFLEQRRRGLVRWLNFALNHPVLREDGLLKVFLTELSLESWRKSNTISLEEESMTKSLDRADEMAIPSDLEEKLTTVRGKLPVLIDQWQRISLIAERMAKRREFASADLFRLQMSFNGLSVLHEQCWRGDECELCFGVRQGMSRVAGHAQTVSDMLEIRTGGMMSTTVEYLKSQRDLYISMRDMLIRHNKLGLDQVDRIRKRVETASSKLENIRNAKKDGWDIEAERITNSIEKDQAMIAQLLARRVYIRHSMWHELRVVLHNRENTLLTVALQSFAAEERDFMQRVQSQAITFAEEMENMPLG